MVYVTIYTLKYALKDLNAFDRKYLFTNFFDLSTLNNLISISTLSANTTANASLTQMFVLKTTKIITKMKKRKKSTTKITSNVQQLKRLTTNSITTKPNTMKNNKLHTKTDTTDVLNKLKMTRYT